MRLEFVHCAVQRVLGQFREVRVQQVFEGARAHPIGHGMFRLGIDEAVEHHDAGQRTGPRAKPLGLEDVIEPQALPELVTHVDRPALAVLLGFDLVHQHADDWLRIGHGLRWRLSPLACAHFGHDALGFLIGPLEEIALAHQGHLDLVHEPEPLGPGARPEIPQRTDRSLPRPLGGMDGLN